jgi:hypothetical protein
MTAKQITTKLEAAGISMKGIEVRRDELEIWTGNMNSTERLMNKISKALGWSGYRCGYGGWVLRAGYKVDTASYCDKSSRIHY